MLPLLFRINEEQWSFSFLIERDEQQDLRLLFFKNEEELVRYRLSERLVTMSDEVVGEERTEAFLV